MAWDIALDTDAGGFVVVDEGTGAISQAFKRHEDARGHLSAILAGTASPPAVAATSTDEGAPNMGDDFIRLESASGLTAEDITDDGRQWIHVLPLADKARNGPWHFTIDEGDLGAYAQYVIDNPERIPVDYDHGSARSSQGGSSRAAGWFTGQATVLAAGAPRPTASREVAEAAELWAEVRWTPRARQEIQDGEFRFLSPEFTFQERDAKSGLMTKAKELVAATLTNRPFFRQLSPVTAAELDAELLDVVAQTMGQDVADDLASEDPEKRAAAVAAISERMKAEAEETPPEETPEPDANPSDEPVPADAPTPEPPVDTPPEAADDDQEVIAMASTDVLAALGVPEHADDATVVAAIQAKDDEITTLKGTIDELKAVEGQAHELANRVATLESQARKREVAIVLADEVRTGRVAPVEVEHLARHYESNIDDLKELVNARPIGMFAKIGEAGSGGDAPASDPKLAALADEFRATDPLDEESATLHVQAVELLESQGKHTYTSEEYMAALDAASKVAA